MAKYPSKRGEKPVDPYEDATVAAPDDEPETSKDSDEDILKEAKERWQRALDNSSENRSNYREDYHFVFTPGSQWPGDIRAMRARWKEPCLEYNQLKQFVHQVVNDQRQNRPGIRIIPGDGPSSEESAELRQGLIRAIEYDSQAESVYDTGFECAVVGGRGWWRICTEYLPNSFHQKICIKAIKDSLSIVADDDYQNPDASDRRFLFAVERIPKDEFTKLYPKAQATNWDSMDDEWVDDDAVLVMDYYRRICTIRTLVMMSDGAIGWKDEMPKPPAGVYEIASRESEDYTVEWYKLGGDQVLERYECPGAYIPVIQTVGDEAVIEGKRLFQGLVRDARDPQRMLNFGLTQQAVHLALTPRAPWVVAAGQVDRYKDIWKNANVENYGYLPYDPVEIGGSVAPAPQRTAPSLPDTGWQIWTQTQVQMIKSTIGMYENSLGQRATEQSGRAIIAREKQGDMSTFHFSDNQSRAIALTGRIVNEWLPVYYDKQRTVTAIGMDDTRRSVMINQPSLEGAVLNQLKPENNTVVVESGPSYATKRQESAEKLSELVRAFPPLMQAAGDLIIKAQDIPDADTIADRVKLMLPPPVQQAIQAQEQGQRPPDPQTMQAMMQKDQQLQQAKQMMGELTQENQRLKSGVADKMQAAQLESQVRMESVRAEAAAKLQQAQLDADISLQEAQINAETELRKATIDAENKFRIAQVQRATDLQIEQMKLLAAPPQENQQ